MRKNWPIKALEAMALLEGMENILDECRKNGIGIEIESDALEVINILTRRSEDLSETKNITDTILLMVSSPEEVIFKHCSRRVNTLAHSIARFGSNPAVMPSFLFQGVTSRGGEGCIFWGPEFPSWFRVVVPDSFPLYEWLFFFKKIY